MDVLFVVAIFISVILSVRMYGTCMYGTLSDYGTGAVMAVPAHDQRDMGRWWVGGV